MRYILIVTTFTLNLSALAFCAIDSNNLAIDDVAITNINNKTLADKAAAVDVVKVDKSFQNFFKYTNGRRMETQDLEEFESIKAEYEAYQIKFQEWLKTRKAGKSSSKKKWKLEQEYQKYLDRLETTSEETDDSIDDVEYEIVPHVSSQHSLVAQESSALQVQIIENLNTFLSQYPETERAKIQTLWDSYAPTYPDFAKRLIHIGIRYEEVNDLEKAKGFYDIFMHLRHSIDVALNLNLLTLKTNTCSSLRAFKMFFNQYKITISATGNRPTASALSCLTHAITFAESIKRDASIFRHTTETSDMFFPVYALDFLKVVRNRIVFWHLSNCGLSNRISQKPSVQAAFADALVRYFQNEIPYKNLLDNVLEFIDDPLYCFSHNLGYSTNNDGRSYFQTAYVLKKTMTMEDTKNHQSHEYCIQIRKKTFSDDGSTEITFGILRKSPIRKSANGDDYLQEDILKNKENEILKIGLLRSPLLSLVETMPTTLAARILMDDPVNPSRKINYNSYFKNGKPADIMGNHGCAIVHNIFN